MIKVETDSILLSKIREKDMESIINWFNERKVSFYKLGWTYLKNHHEIEDVFHQVILKVYKEIKHLKKDTYFEAGVTSIFINKCRDLSKNSQEKSLQVSEKIMEDETNQNVFHALDQLEDIYKEPILLTYLKELTEDEVAYILQIPVETVKFRLYKGIDLLREGIGYGIRPESCKNYQEKFIDYLGKKLNRPEKVELEIHLHTCQSCQNDLSFFQDIIFTLTRGDDSLNIPSDFMQKVKYNVNETEKVRIKIKKKRSIFGLAASSIFILIICISLFTNTSTYIYYSWVDWRTQEDEQMLEYLKSGLSEQLDLVEVSNGVKVKIKSAIGDEFQTLIYYEIEDINEENQYLINSFDGVMIENEHKVLNHEVHPRYSPPTNQIALKNEEKNLYNGSFSILPISSDKETLILNLTKLQSVVQDPTNPASYDQIEYIEGNWSFEIPITKHPSIVHELEKETKINEIPIRFDKLTIAPTTTLLQYSYQDAQPDMQVGNINIQSLETKKKKVKVDLYGGGIFGNNSYGQGWNTVQTSFETLYFEEPKEVSVHFGSINMFIDDKKTIDLDVSKDFPQSFEYIGNKISIDSVTIGNSTKVVITDAFTEDRPYETLQFQIVTDKGQEGLITNMSGDGVLIDKNGKEYNMNDYYQFDMLDQPRYYQTSHIIELSNDFSDEQFIPKNLEIYGYNTTKYVEDIVDISLD